MAHSLEARSALFDPDLMELAASLPASLKTTCAGEKVALRNALRGWIPDSILNRPKAGFPVPIADRFRDEPRSYAADVLLDRAMRERGYLRGRVVESILNRRVAGREDNSPRIWPLLMLELWPRGFVAPE